MLKLIVTAAAMLLPGAALAEDWGAFYAEVYGGAAIGTDSEFGSVYEMDSTWTAGAAFGVDMGNGFSLGLDVMKTGDAEFSAFPGYSLSNFSVMAEGEYALALNDTFAVYGSLGLGAINIAYDNGVDVEDAWGAGYSAAVGVRVNVTESLAMFGEFKHQDTFSPVDLNGADLSAPTNAALLGVRLSF